MVAPTTTCPLGRQQRQRAPGGDRRPRGPDLVPPLAFVERRGRGRGEPGRPGPHPEPPVGPAKPADRDPGRHRDRRDRDHRGGHLPVREELPHPRPRPVRRGDEPEPHRPGSNPRWSRAARAQPRPTADACRAPARRRPRSARQRPSASTTPPPHKAVAASTPATRRNPPPRAQRASPAQPRPRRRQQPRSAAPRGPRAPRRRRTGCGGAACGIPMDTGSPALKAGIRAAAPGRKPGLPLCCHAGQAAAGHEGFRFLTRH